MAVHLEECTSSESVANRPSRLPGSRGHSRLPRERLLSPCPFWEAWGDGSLVDLHVIFNFVQRIAGIDDEIGHQLLCAASSPDRRDFPSVRIYEVGVELS